MPQRSGPAASVLGSVRKLFTSLLSAGETRLKLVIVELQEERNRFFSLLITAMVALLMAAFGIGMLVLWVVVYFWDTHRLLAIGSAAGILLVLAIILGLRVKYVASRPTLLRSTLEHLGEDREQLEDRVEEHAIGRRLEKEAD
ncbi:phage holin family protein [Carnimonas bestiolae]|uniref:phage holin family protein n=1 Tax=Carnimonas bestiolae TaxID=3402172 RepID=UPI003EDC15EA